MFTMPYVARRVATVLSGLSLVTILAPAIVVAAPPATQALNPEPPDFYTCKPVGGGTICRALTSDPYGPDATGIFCGGVELLDQGTRMIAATRYYDADGNLTRRERVYDFDDTHLTNPLTGATVYYHQHNTDWEVLGVPGDLSSATLHGHGEMIVTVPGSGSCSTAAACRSWARTAACSTAGAGTKSPTTTPPAMPRSSPSSARHSPADPDTPLPERAGGSAAGASMPGP